MLIREGTTEKNLASIVPLFVHDSPPDPTQFAFCSDDRHPTDIIAEGHINFCIQKSIALGLDPLIAVQMGTINCARNFGIDRELGGLAPGKLADILIVEDLSRFIPDVVIVGGRIVARDGQLTIDFPEPSYPSHFLNSVKISRPLLPSDFRIEVPRGPNRVKVRVIEARERRIWSEEGSEWMACAQGEIRSDPEKDVLKLAVVERYGRTKGPNIGLGFIRGFGLKQGAIASSIDQDKHDLAYELQFVKWEYFIRMSHEYTDMGRPFDEVRMWSDYEAAVR